MPKDLNNLHILVTRPKPQGEILCEEIRQHGGQPIFFPTIEILPAENSQTLQTNLANLDQYDWIIFISPQAVYQTLNKLSHQAIKAKIAAIGEGTARALQAAQWTVDIYPSTEWSSEGLLELPEFKNVHNKKIAIIKGANGRELLTQELRFRGAEVITIIAYQRVIPKVKIDHYLDLLQKNGIDVVICTSNEGLQNLKTLLQNAWSKLQTLTLVVISERMACRAKELGFKNILQAKNANHEAILQTIVKGKIA